jgi:lactate permease
MYQQVYDPIGDSLGLSSLFAVLPLVTLFVLLGGLRLRAHWAGLAGLAVALIVAIAVYEMPVGQAFDSALLGAFFGLFPIMWIVVNAIWIYNMTERTGYFAVLRRSFSRVSDDQRIQAIVIAFSFGALIEALAGFGTPVAITVVMLIALGFRPIKAVAVSLVANTAPVAFGAIATPIITLASVTELPKEDLGAMVGRQTPFLALIVPFVLVAMVDGRRGLRQTAPAAAVGGAAFAVAQFVCSNYISVELTDIVASLVSAGAIVALMQVWSPSEHIRVDDADAPGRPALAGGAIDEAPATGRDGADRRDRTTDPRGDVIRAYLPYVIIIVVFAIPQLFFKDFITEGITPFQWPGLDIVNADGEAISSIEYNPNSIWTGTLLLVSGLITMFVVNVGPGRALAIYGETLNQLKWAILTVAAVLALAYVMNQSGQTITLGLWMAGAGGLFAFLSSILGWLGVAVTGSDTSSNALFGALQVTAAQDAGLSGTLMAAANSSGGVLGKMISPQNLAIGAAAAGLAGQEGDIFRRVVGWSLVLLLAMCVIVYLQSTAVLDWMVLGQ